MTVLGYSSTVAGRASTSCSCWRTAVRRGLRTPFLIADLPFGSYEVSDEQAIATAHALRQGGGLRRRQARGRRRDLGRPRPGDRRGRHPGDGPRRADAADRDRARRLQGPGPHRRGARRASPKTRWRCRTPAASRSSSRRSRARSTEELMPRWRSRSSGSAPGRPTDGQVLVFHDLLGIREGRGRALRQALRRPHGRDGRAASRAYADDVRTKRYPAPEHTLLDRPGRAGGLPHAPEGRVAHVMG